MFYILYFGTHLKYFILEYRANEKSIIMHTRLTRLTQYLITAKINFIYIVPIFYAPFIPLVQNMSVNDNEIFRISFRVDIYKYHIR